MDRRLTPATDRVVARWCAEDFPALTPVDPERMYVTAPVADLCRSPGGPRDRQLVYGSVFEVYEWRGDHAFGIAPSLGLYVGWVRSDGLRHDDDRPPAGAWVTTRQTHAYTDPDFKSPDTLALSHGARLFAGERHGRFTRTELGWVPSRHMTERASEDPVAVAERFLGTPYLWGGNSCWGIDCSGLVQAALTTCGLDSAGDSDMQEQSLGTTLPKDTPPERGDLLFWKGHVAWVADPHTLLHANAHHMAVAQEPLKDAVCRIAEQGDGPVTRHARLA